MDEMFRGLAWMDGARRDGTRGDGGVCPPDGVRVRVCVRVD